MAARKKSLSRRGKEIPEKYTQVQKKRRPFIRKASLKKRQRTSTYNNLGDYFKNLKGKDAVVLSLLKIESILGRKLPVSARKHVSWWANSQSAIPNHPRTWLKHGYRVTNIDLKKGTITFSKVHGKGSMPYAAMLIEAAQQLHAEDKAPFTPKNLFTKARALHRTEIPPSTNLYPVLAYITRSTTNTTSGQWKGTLVRLSRGVYRLTAKGVKTETKRKQTSKAPGNAFHSRLCYHLQNTKGWCLSPGTMKAGWGLPEFRIDLATQDGKVAIQTLHIKDLRSKRDGLTKLFAHLYTLEKIQAKEKALIIETTKTRNITKTLEGILQPYKRLLRGITLYTFHQGNKAKKDQLETIKP
ncbi:MAG TPA: hypothetical protein PLD04_14805 [Thermoanaerobaculia bacterium]|nr:hypothetical protein [Thermoanaerobaculia bacterium]